MDLEAKWQRWMGAAQHINAALKVCYRLGLCLYEMGAPDKTEMKTNLVSEGTQNNFGVFPICIAAPNFKKECFAPALLEKKLCQNCEFFPEIFRCLLVQTGFLLATMGVGYPVAFEKSHWPLLNTQWPWAFVTALPRNAELCGPIVLLYLFYSLGGGSFYVLTKKKKSKWKRGELRNWFSDWTFMGHFYICDSKAAWDPPLRGADGPQGASVGRMPWMWMVWKVLPGGGASQGLLGQAVWGHCWERKPSLIYPS